MADFCKLFNSCVVNSLCIFVVIVSIFFATSDSSYDGSNGKGDTLSDDNKTVQSAKLKRRRPPKSLLNENIPNDLTQPSTSREKVTSVVQEPNDVLQYKVYHKLDDVLAVLQDPKYKNWTLVTKLMDVWESENKPRRLKQPLSDKRQYPYIQIEGMQRNLRRAFCRELAKGMGAKYIRNIPRTFYRFRRKFDKDLELKRAFVALGNYVTSMKLKYELEERPVVMAGFWMNQAALYVAKKYLNVDDFPANGSDIYKWPVDLERPDLIFFHNVIRETPTRKQENEALLQRIAQAYVRFIEPSVIELNDTFSNMNREHMRHVRKIIRNELHDRYQELDL